MTNWIPANLGTYRKCECCGVLLDADSSVLVNSDDKGEYPSCVYCGMVNTPRSASVREWSIPNPCFAADRIDDQQGDLFD